MAGQTADVNRLAALYDRLARKFFSALRFVATLACWS